MVRAVHVEKVLSLCSCRGEGALRIEISDPLLEENRGVWKLFFAPGRENLVEKTAEAPDLSLTIGDFSTLICGIRSAEELPGCPRRPSATVPRRWTGFSGRSPAMCWTCSKKKRCGSDPQPERYGHTDEKQSGPVPPAAAAV